MTTKYAYLSLVTSSGAYRNFKFKLNAIVENRLRNLKAGSITTFDLEEDNTGWVNPTNAYGELQEQTVTIYPHCLALLDIKIVELEESK